MKKITIGIKKKPAKILMTATLTLRSKHPDKLPEFRKGMGKGVLAIRDVEFTDANGRGFDTPLFAMELVDCGEQMIGDLLEIKWAKKPARKAVRL